ncbi:PhzF family phenazine biosynthesis protein [Nakamurella deserti]|uniref:PhzF family phenazine biosynthesis protein n=1 Tax=Nakamurella deserti TaxID=2164074 RepID=UPI000DBE6FF8|nr:PhzF family phenazine biosynthesis protein [Nakamurella deserti]
MDVLEYAAFADGPGGGNPAGIVLDATDLDDATMQRVAAEVGHAETAFVVARDPADPRALTLRYFSPQAEVPFCGHATVATAVALAERQGVGTFRFATAPGLVVIATATTADGIRATFTSVEPAVTTLEREVLDRLLTLLHLDRSDLDDRHPPAEAFAGNRHPVVVLRDPSTFDGFGFDPAAVRALMDEQGWAGTVTVLIERDPTTFEARNLFPVGAITEDPATGSAAASVGAYLRATGAVTPPATVTIHQGRHVGRPSRLTVDVGPAGGIRVSGGAVRMGVS